MKKNRKQQHLRTDTAAPKTAAQDSPKTPVSIVAQIPEERIRQRAHEISTARGGAPGHEVDDWLQAEREIKAEVDRACKAQS